ncbi:uncharacterized protein LOC123807921 [Phyllostomus hastatus]|uniref:uncharacterized protein LOC123807921 n=1 Tax=Phyllostomus hastatus TaxID=9423 RepID=UPI001E681453|nr:uncharacterized protein LOC123807921 [Phyllostomus hastatus]
MSPKAHFVLISPDVLCIYKRAPRSSQPLAQTAESWMERALARRPWPQLLPKNRGAHARIYPSGSLFRDEVTVHLLVFEDHLLMASRRQEDAGVPAPGLPPARHAAPGRDPHPGSGRRKLKRTPPRQPAAVLTKGLNQCPSEGALAPTPDLCCACASRSECFPHFDAPCPGLSWHSQGSPRPVCTCCLPSSPPFPLQPTASCPLCSVGRLSLRSPCCAALCLTGQFAVPSPHLCHLAPPAASATFHLLASGPKCSRSPPCPCAPGSAHPRPAQPQALPGGIAPRREPPPCTESQAPGLTLGWVG